MNAPLISLKGLSKEFHGKNVIELVDLNIKAGEFFGILGPSGCGKTTLLRLIAGLEQPSSGQIIIDGLSMNSVPANRRPVNTVFQSYAIFPHMSLEDNIGYGLKLKGIVYEKIKERVGAILDIVDLSGLEGRWPNELSGGQLQRVALARALAPQPSVSLPIQVLHSRRCPRTPPLSLPPSHTMRRERRPVHPLDEGSSGDAGISRRSRAKYSVQDPSVFSH